MDVAFTFGRFNPPTKGHIQHFGAMREFSKARAIPYYVFVSKTVDDKNNPLPVEMKIYHLRKCMPDTPVLPETNMFTAAHALVTKFGFTHLHYFAGGDYFDDPKEASMFDRLQEEVKKLNGTMSVVMSGNRQRGISGTDLRQCARDERDQEFYRNVAETGSLHDSRDLLNAIRRVYGLKNF